MGFNTWNSIDFCEPNCQKRKPGCHGGCKYYKEKRAAYEERKAIVEKDREIKQYTASNVSRILNNQAKQLKTSTGKKWSRGNQ